MSTCSRLDLETLGSWRTMPNNFPSTREAYLQKVVYENNPSDHETWPIRCHVRIHINFTPILHSHTHSVGPSSGVWWCELGPTPPFHQWECLKCNNGQGLSASYVKWPSRADHIGRFQHHPSASPAIIIMWKVVGQHLFLNLIPGNFIAGTKQKVWCDRGMTGRSHGAVLTPSVGTSDCNSGKKMVGYHLFLNLILNNFTAETKRKAWCNVREEPKASVLSAHKICDLAYKILKV